MILPELPLLPIGKDNICICFSSDNNYAKHLSIALMSLVANSKSDSFYDLIILDVSLSDENKRLLKMIINPHINFSLRFLSVFDDVNNNGLITIKHINKSAYARYTIFDKLKGYKRVIYLDSDIIVNHDIADLYEFNLEGKCIGAVKDTVVAVWITGNHCFNIRHKKFVMDELNLSDAYNYFNSGVIIFDMEEIAKNSIKTSELFEVSIKKRWHDQNVLNYIFNKKVKYLPANWNVMVDNNTCAPIDMDKSVIPEALYKEYVEAKKAPNIIHYAGQQQPIYNKNAEFCDLYWSYARTSPFYQEIIFEKNKYGKSIKNKFKSIVKRIFPYHTRRGKNIRYLVNRL